ncbi:hypothetical protein EC588_23630 [Klebsiella quasipneumoniae subsp. similipneumoniae]|nr:hypothetical protein EC588_23630 [Klebsiella quasipneumoniae subsp. similipneumoniae]
MPRFSPSISSAFMVSLLFVENDITLQTGLIADRSRTTERYAQRLPFRIYVTSPQHIWTAVLRGIVTKQRFACLTLSFFYN